MRPSLNILEPELIGRVVDEAKRVLAEHGFEIRGAEMRRRLIEAGCPQREDGRILFPRAIVEEALRTAPSSFQLFDRDGLPRADLGGDRVHFIPGSRRASTSPSTSGSATASPTSRTSRPPSRRARSSHRCPMRGGSTCA